MKYNFGWKIILSPSVSHLRVGIENFYQFIQPPPPKFTNLIGSIGQNISCSFPFWMKIHDSYKGILPVRWCPEDVIYLLDLPFLPVHIYCKPVQGSEGDGRWAALPTSSVRLKIHYDLFWLDDWTRQLVTRPITHTLYVAYSAIDTHLNKRPFEKFRRTRRWPQWATEVGDNSLNYDR